MSSSLAAEPSPAAVELSPSPAEPARTATEPATNAPAAVNVQQSWLEVEEARAATEVSVSQSVSRESWSEFGAQVAPMPAGVTPSLTRLSIPEAGEYSFVPPLPTSVREGEASAVNPKATSIAGRVRVTGNGIEMLDVDVMSEHPNAQWKPVTPELHELFSNGENVETAIEMSGRLVWKVPQFSQSYRVRMELFIAAYQGFLHTAANSQAKTEDVYAKVRVMNQARSAVLDKLQGNLLAASPAEFEALVGSVAQNELEGFNDEVEAELQAAYKAINEALGDPLRVNVYFEDVSLTAYLPADGAKPAALRGKATVVSQSIKLVCGVPMALSRAVRARVFHQQLTAPKPILTKCSGVLEAGRITLVLGPPGAGKTTLLKALMGKLRHTRGKQELGGKIKYNGHDISSNSFHTANYAAYVDQIDEHIPILTVTETLEFAKACRDALAGYSAHVGKGGAELDRLHEKNQKRIQLTLAFLGLTRAENTIIGNDVMKGVSGGEKRRVTLGEMLVVGARVLFLDEISTGLDSAATFDITNTLRKMARILGSTVVVSLLQPPPETLDLFDDILLVDQGRIMYHGPRADVIAYFESLGFAKPQAKDVGDYLQEVTHPIDGKQYHRPTSELGGLKPPSTADEFAAAWAQTDVAKAMAAKLADTASHQSENPLDAYTAARPKYAKSYGALMRVVIRRQWRVILRNETFIKARVGQNVVMGLIFGALMWQIDFGNYYLKCGMLLQFSMFTGLSSNALIPDIVLQRNVFYKQNRQNFYPPFAHCFADAAVGLPFNAFDTFVFGSILYFMCGLTLSDGGAHYWIFLLLGISFACCMSNMVRLCAYASRDQSSAVGICVLLILFSLIFSGGMATYDVIPDGWIWMYWLSPIAWALRSFVQNEFLSSQYTEGDDCSGMPCKPCWYAVTAAGLKPQNMTPDQIEAATNGLNCGEYFLDARQFETEAFWTWTGFAVQWCYLMLTLLCSTAALTYIHHDETRGDEDAGTATIEDQAGADAHPSSNGVHISGEGEAEPALPFTKMTLVFQDLVYTLQLPGPIDENGKPGALIPVDLLKGVSGYAEPHKMTALMGSSGAGKTTLLDVLASRKTQGIITGGIYTNGLPKDDETFITQMGYVEQFGVHSEMSTVLESLQFSAELRLPQSTSAERRTRLVKETMELLELQPIADRLVGKMGNADALSFEEVKRLTIGVELVANPSIIFLDEPTSGLDARAAAIVMGGMQKIAKTGRAIICTIHQPSTAIFEKFDSLLLMKRGGEVVFFGPLGFESANLKSYFFSYPATPPLAESMNPATWMLDVIGAGTGSGSGFDFANAYRISELGAHNAAHIEGQLGTFKQEASLGNLSPHSPVRDLERPKTSKLSGGFQTSVCTQMRCLTWRALVVYWRSPSYSLIRWLITLFFMLVIGSLYFQTTVKVVADVQSLVMVLGFVLQFLGMYNMFVVVPFMFESKALFYREKASRMYSPWVFAICYGWTELPFIFIEVAIDVNIIYWMVGLASEPAWAFWYFWFSVLMYTSFMTLLGQTFTFLLPNAAAAQVVSVMFAQLMALFAGTTVPGSQIPTWLIWLSYMSPQRWATEGIIVTQFENDQTPFCNPSGDLIYVNNTPVSCSTGMLTIVKQYVLGDPNEAFTSPDFGLYGGETGYYYENRFYDWLFVILVFFATRVIVIYAALRISYQKR